MRYDLIEGGLWQHLCKNRVPNFYVRSPFKRSLDSLLKHDASMVYYFHLCNNRVPSILFLIFLQHLARVFHVIQDWFSTKLSHLNSEEDYRG